MKLTLHKHSGGRDRLPGSDSEHGIALVITLLFLSVITFLAIAFLALTQRNRAAVTTAVDSTTSQMMSEAAQARAQSEIIARMMSQTDLLNYDYLASHNYINALGFTNNQQIWADPNNVNYDYVEGGPNNYLSLQQPQLEQNIANLLYDPRAPVFVLTNPAYPTNYDFRFWVDENQNEHFESNGFYAALDETGNALVINGATNYHYFNGEPEWVGVLRDPLYPHSATNPFIGRYAYMILPVGKTLDANFIHNFSKSVGIDGFNSTRVTPSSPSPFSPADILDTESFDGFIRNEGVGSWELNLAAYLEDLNTNIYQNGVPASYLYDYTVPSTFGEPPPGEAKNSGIAFNDAFSMIYFRYGSPPYSSTSNWTPASLDGNFDIPLSSLQNIFATNDIDEFGVFATTGANQFETFLSQVNPKYRNQVVPDDQWPGSYNTNMYYDVEDFLDSNKTSPDFVSRLTQFMWTNTDTQKGGPYTGQIQYDRYTFQRLLATMGTGSSPEYGVFVYSNGFTFVSNNVLTYSTNLNGALTLLTNATVLSNNNTITYLGTPVFGSLPSWLRTKVNLNYNNLVQITNDPLADLGTNLLTNGWTPLAFFTNAADLLLHSQEFPVTNYLGQLVGYNHFGLTNIPIYSSVNPGIRYNSQIHRLLQVAANIYQDTSPTNFYNTGFGTTAEYPYVFRPRFSAVLGPNNIQTIYITNYELMTANDFTTWYKNQSAEPFRVLSDFNDIYNDLGHLGEANIWGIPWIVAAVKGVPSFNRINFASSIGISKQIICVKENGHLSQKHPDFTNEFYVSWMTNVTGFDLWNSSVTNFLLPVTIYATNYYSVLVTNNYNFGYPTNFSVIFSTNLTSWPGRATRPTYGFLPFCQTNVMTLPLGYYSTANKLYANMLVLSNELAQVPLAKSVGQLNGDLTQTTWTQYDWSMIVSNSIVYYIYDHAGNLLDFVNIGPIVESNNLTSEIITNTSGVGAVGSSTPTATPGANYWIFSPHTTTGTGTLVFNQGEAIDQGAFNIVTAALSDGPKSSFVQQYGGTASTNWFGPDQIYPTVLINNMYEWVANDPLVHYTLDDLTWPGNTASNIVSISPMAPPIIYPPTNLFHIGLTSGRYQPWGVAGSVPPTSDQAIGPIPRAGYEDPAVSNSDLWVFPTNKFPSVGWLGRVHRGTPWQTVYLKSEAPTTGGWQTWVNTPADGVTAETNPTNDWRLIDLFTAWPNDNAACGLLSVNQTNDAAWAAVFGGVIALTNVTGGYPIDPTNSIYYIMDTNGINSIRPTNAFGQALPFHHIGDILAAPTLTVSSPASLVAPSQWATAPDWVMEAIPQQTLGLLKVGLPQFVIYAWGQSLRPRNVDLSPSIASHMGLCTNYEITGEYETRTVCHVVGDPYAQHPQIIIDSFNVVPNGP